MLKARFFGTGQITFGEESETITLSGRIQALFTYLCVTGQPQDRSKLGDLLWDNLTEQDAKSNLRYILRDLRKVIGDYLIVNGQTIAFNFELPHWFDTTSFTTYLAPHLRTASAQIDLSILKELLNLYTSDFLDSFHIQDASNFEQWVVMQRRHFHDTMVYGLQLATQQHLYQGDYEAGLALNQYLLTLEPWREEAHRQRMILLAASGQRSAALMQYELCCQILEEELDVPPMTETTSLYTQIKSGIWFIEQKSVSEFNNQRVAIRPFPQTPAGNVLPAAQQNTTVEPTVPQIKIDLGTMSTTGYFTGRRNELAALQRWLDDEQCQFAAILGLGGQGKSTLAAWFVQEQCAKLNTTSAYSFTANGHKDSQLVKHWPIAPSSAGSDSAEPANALNQIIWRSFAQRPSCITLMQDLIQQLGSNTPTTLSKNFDQLATVLFDILQQRRSLIVLDGIETILYGSTSEQQTETDSYEQFFQLFIERPHRSRLLVTSRVRPAMLTHMQQQKNQVYCLELEGLSQADSEEYLKALGLESTRSDYQRLHELYVGNPLMLGQVANLIHELFAGDIATFLQEEIHFLSNIGASLAQQIAQLPTLQHQILQILANADESLSRQALWEQLPETPKSAYYGALWELQRTHLIHQAKGEIRAAGLPTSFITEKMAQLEMNDG